MPKTPKRPRLSTLPPRIKALDSRTVKPPPRTFASRKAAEPEAMAFYGSTAWQQFRAQIIAERGYRCERDGSTPSRVYVDHIKELKDGGAPLDPANVEVLCPSCHGKKTVQARIARLCEPIG